MLKTRWRWMSGILSSWETDREEDELETYLGYIKEFKVSRWVSSLWLWWRPMTRSNPGRKTFFPLRPYHEGKLGWELKVETWVRNWSRGHEGELIVGLLCWLSYTSRTPAQGRHWLHWTVPSISIISQENISLLTHRPIWRKWFFFSFFFY